MKRDWFSLYDGSKFVTLKPDPDLLTIENIAHQLSLTARFRGATERILSVAQHSVLVSIFLERDGYDARTSLWGLLHDSGETLTGDVQLGIKHLLPGLKMLEDSYLKLIIQKYGLSWPMPDAVHKWDVILGNNEALSFIKGASLEYFGIEKPNPVIHMTLWTSEYAEHMFLDRFKILKAAKSSQPLKPA